MALYIDRFISIDRLKCSRAHFELMNLLINIIINFYHFENKLNRYILRDVRPHIPKGYVYTLHDIGLVINKLMGGAYR